MKQKIKAITSVLIYIYLGISLLAMLIGMSQYYLMYENGCFKPKSRLRISFPAYDFGCWLLEVPK